MTFLRLWRMLGHVCNVYLLCADRKHKPLAPCLLPFPLLPTVSLHRQPVVSLLLSRYIHVLMYLHKI